MMSADLETKKKKKEINRDFSKDMHRRTIRETSPPGKTRREDSKGRNLKKEEREQNLDLIWVGKKRKKQRGRNPLKKKLACTH